MFGARLKRYHDEFVQPQRLVFHVFAAAEAIYRQPHRLVQRTRFQLDGVLNAIRILERHPALLHSGSISYSVFLRHVLRLGSRSKDQAIANRYCGSISKITPVLYLPPITVVP